MDRSVKQPGTGIDEAWVGLIGGAGVVGLVEAAGISLRMAEVIGGPEQDVTWNPIDLSLRLWLTHDLVWSGQATASAVFLGVGALGSVAGSAMAWRYLCSQPWKKGKRKRHDIDAQARYMGRGKRIASLKKPEVAAVARRLKVALPQDIPPGVPIGETVTGRREMLYGTYEDLHLDIWGPRTGKSTSRVIPAIMDAFGAVVSTSNKRDVVDATREHRSTVGDIWTFDPQGVAANDDDNEATWYWDPIGWIADGGSLAVMEQRAAELTGHFEAQGGDGRRDAFFDNKATNLLTAMFLAAVVGERPITEVYRWVARPTDDRPAQLLANARGFHQYAAGLATEYDAPPKQRDGIFGTAEKMIACLKLASIEAWVTPPMPGEKPRKAFDVAEFAKSTDTLYALSKESKGNAGALVTALTAAVCGAAMDLGTRLPGGRLSTPMLAVLDEAANIVKWADLPKLYSHFGSRGIIVMTILQSWGQGVRCWGSDGMETLWSAANIRVLGSGVDHAAFLRDRSELIGDHYELNTNVSKGRGGSSQSTSRTAVRTLTPADLASLPKGRAVVFTSGNPAILIRTVPWHERPYADKIRASLTRHEPKPREVSTPPRLRIVPVIEETA